MSKKRIVPDFDYASPNGKNPIRRIAYFDAFSYGSTVLYLDVIFSASPTQKVPYLIFSELQRSHPKMSKSGNSMRLGVIPIVSKWAAFDEIRDYGYMLRSLDIASINDALEWMQDLPLAKIESLSNSCIEFSKKYYNLERFQQEFSAYIDNLLSNA